MLKKRILCFIVSLCMLISVISGSAYAKDAKTIVILYENDVHCVVEGYSKLSAMKKELMEEYDHVGVVSSGDFVQGGTLGAVSKGEYIVTLMNLVGYDALTLGNHEFDYKLSRLDELTDLMDTKPVSCNFRKTSESKTYFEPYTIVSYGDVDVAYIGITTPYTLASSSPAQFKDEDGEYVYTFSAENLYDVVQENIDSAKQQGADYIIALSYIGYEEDDKNDDIKNIIENTEGLDVVLDGHSHTVIENMVISDEGGNEVVLTSTGSKFENIGKLTISDGIITTELIETESYTNTDPVVDDKIEEIKEEYSALGNRIIAQSEVDLITHDGDKRLVRTKETNLGNLVSDAYRIVTGADIGYVNGGGIRAPIFKGDVTFNDMLSAFPYNNKVIVAEVTGQTIKDFLEHAVKYWPNESGAFPHVSGIKFSVNASMESAAQVDISGVFTGIEGEYRVYDIMVLDKDSGEYKPLDPDKNYSVASDSYHLLDCGDGMTMFENVTVLQDDGTIDVELFENYITENLNGVIGEEYKEVDNRILFTDIEVSQIDVIIDWSRVPALNEGDAAESSVDSRENPDGYIYIDCEGLDYYQYGWATYCEEEQRWVYTHHMGDEYRINSDDRYALVFVAILKPTHFYADEINLKGFGDATRQSAPIKNIIGYTLEIDGKFTDEPSTENDYTVNVNNDKGVSYQWFSDKPDTVDVTDKNVDLELDNYDETEKIWSGVCLAEGDPYFYFGVDLVKGENLVLEFLEDVEGSVVLMGMDEDYILTPDENGKYSYTAPNLDVYVLAVESDCDTVPDLKATKGTKYTLLEGQTSNKLNTKNLKSGNYFCRVTWDMGTPQDSTDDYSTDTSLVNYTAPIRKSSGGGTATYIVKFNTDGGSEISNQTIARNGKVKRPNAPVKAGYEFDGWFADADLTTPYDFESGVTKTITLYAKWQKIKDTPKPEDADNHICYTAKFEDLDVKEWYHEAIDGVVGNGIFHGVTQTKFGPEDMFTRAMLVAALYRTEGEPEAKAENIFEDVDENQWYADAVRWATENKIVFGINDKEFAPDAKITREQIAAILHRYADYKKYDVTVEENTNILSYDDFDSISEYAIGSMQWAFGSGLITGKSETTLNPLDQATRAEAAAILHRFIKTE